MRFSTSVSQTSGSTLLSLAVWMCFGAPPGPPIGSQK
jgi:hypothetical protein